MVEHYEKLTAHLRSAWRFRRLGIGVAWGIAVLGWLLVCLIPSQYESSARVYVDTNTLLRPLLEGITVAENTGSQLDLVRRALLSRPQLERVIDSTELRDRIHSARGRELEILDLSKSIQIRVDTSIMASRDPNTFQIVYADSNADLALHVVDGLLQYFVAQSKGAARSDADAAQQFLRAQIADYEQRLTQAEARLTDFKEKNIGLMPDDRSSYSQRLQGQLASLDQLRASLAVAETKRDELRGKLRGTSEDGQSAAPAAVSSVDERIRQDSAKLEEMLLRFTDDHPDVVALRETIARLQAQREQELAQLHNNDNELGPTRASSNPLTQNLQISLNQASLEIDALRSQVADAEHRISELRQHVSTMPKVEAELARLSRDYEATKTEYDRLLQRLDSAKLSDAAGRVDDVRFRVLDPPAKGIIPTRPPRLVLMAGVLLAALCGGVAVAYWLAQMKPVFVNPLELRDFKEQDDFKTLREFKDLPILAVIGAANGEVRSRARRWQVAGVLATAAGLTVITASLALFYSRLETAAHQLRATHSASIPGS